MSSSRSSRNLPPTTRAQRRFRRQGYTFEICYLKPSARGPKLIVIHKPGAYGWREYRKHLMPGEVIRPIAKHYIHNGHKP